jgi:hypothetical protein
VRDSGCVTFRNKHLANKTAQVFFPGYNNTADLYIGGVADLRICEFVREAF